MGVTLNFDATNVQPATARDPVPSGWYVGAITASEMKPTDKPGGMYLELEETILEGPYQGFKVFDRLNLQNANPVAVEIAYKQLSAICHAVGVIQVASSDQLHNRPMQIKVTKREAGTNPQNGTQYDANNEVKGYKAVGAQQPTANVAPPPVAPPPVAAAPPAWAPPVAAPAPAPAAPPAWQPPPASAAAPQPPAGAPPWAAPVPAPAAAPTAPPWVAPAAPGAPVAPPWATK